MATSEWLRFFEDAGIPPGPALGYAVAFVDNRIHKDMLLDLTKELMKELGITAVGDVIAILRHARVVHRQELCRAASESLQPPPAAQRGPGGSRRDPERDRDRDQDRDRDRDRDQDRDRDRDQDQDQDQHRDRDRPPGPPCGAAGRMIANSLSREPPRPPRNPPGTGICVTVANGAAGAKAGTAGPRRRRVTAEAEGKYVISLPKGTTARSRKILQLQAARGLGRTSVFERLGAEAKAAAAAGGKPSGVFSRLGAAPGADPDPADPDPADPADPAGAEEALPYAGVLKKRREGPAGGAEAQDGAVSSSVPGDARPPWGCGKVSSSCEPRAARSVFRRLGRKPD